MVSFLNLCGVDVPLPPFCVATPSGLKAEGKTFPPAFNNCDGTNEPHDQSAAILDFEMMTRCCKSAD